MTRYVTTCHDMLPRYATKYCHDMLLHCRVVKLKLQKVIGLALSQINRINKKNIINKINENDITCETRHDIANILNLYFVIIGKHISESMNARPYMIIINILKV